MPIMNNASYLPTMQEFIAHWTRVNAALGTRPLTLTDGFTLAMFTALRTTIQTETDALNAAAMVVAEKRMDVVTQKKQLMVELEQFRKVVLGELDFTVYTASLPTLPDFGSTESRFLKPFLEAANIWSRINASPPPGFTAPLMLPDATLLADFNAMIAALRTAYVALINSEGDQSFAKSNRDASLPDARYYMKQYRIVVHARLAPGDPLLADVPRLTPVAGSTPKSVTNLFYDYNAVTNSVKLTFYPSTSKSIARYDLRYSSGPEYNPANEQTIATLPTTGPFEFDFPLDMVATGDTALFKVYVFNATGNHHASKVLKIKRTAATTLTLTDTSETPLLRAA